MGVGGLLKCGGHFWADMIYVREVHTMHDSATLSQ